MGRAGWNIQVESGEEHLLTTRLPDTAQQCAIMVMNVSGKLKTIIGLVKLLSTILTVLSKITSLRLLESLVQRMLLQNQ